MMRMEDFYFDEIWMVTQEPMEDGKMYKQKLLAKEGANYLLRKTILEDASVTSFDTTFNFQNSS